MAEHGGDIAVNPTISNVGLHPEVMIKAVALEKIIPLYHKNIAQSEKLHLPLHHKKVDLKSFIRLKYDAFSYMATLILLGYHYNDRR